MIENDRSDEWTNEEIKIHLKTLWRHRWTEAIQFTIGTFMVIGFWLLVIWALLFSEKLYAQETSCSRAHLTYNPPTTYVNGAPLEISDIDYYEVQIQNAETGEKYLLHTLFANDINGQPVTQAYYTSKESANVPLLTGKQCFQMRTVMKDKDREPSVWTEITEASCKEICAYHGFKLDISIGVTE